MHGAQVGCGADELIDLVMRCTLDPGDCLVDCPPTFTMYVFDAAVNDARVITVPRLEGFRLDVHGAPFCTKRLQQTLHHYKRRAVHDTAPCLMRNHLACIGDANANILLPPARTHARRHTHTCCRRADIDKGMMYCLL